MAAAPNMTPDAAAESDQARIPPRYWWLTRLGGSYLLCLLLLGATYWWWAHTAAARLDARIAAIQAAGEPIFPADFNRPATDPPGATTAFAKAESAYVDEIKLTPRGKLSVYSAQFRSVRLARPQDVQRLLRANQTALNALHEMRDAQQVNWGVGIASPMLMTLLPRTSTQRDLLQVARLDAVEAHAAGRDNAAVERLRDMLHLARLSEQPPIFVINHLLALSGRANAVHVIQDIASGLRIAGTDDTAPDAAPRAAVEALIADLLDETDSHEGMRDALRAERAAALDAAQFAILGRGAALRIGGGWWTAPARPLLKLDAERVLREATRLLHAATAPNWPAAQALLPAEPTAESDVESMSRVLSTALRPALNRVIWQQYCDLRMRRGGALLLALRLYELDHGAPPTELAALAPNYIPRVPLDPFSADGRPFGYLPQGTRPCIYSVSTDGADDGGRFALRKSGVLDDQTLDYPFFLDGPAPSGDDGVLVDELLGLVAQAGEEQPHVDDGDRNSGDGQKENE